MSDQRFRSTAFREPGFEPGGFSPADFSPADVPPPGVRPRFRQGRPERRLGLSGVLLGVIGLALLPSIEIAAFVAVSARIGFAPALLAFVLTSILGLALLKQHGGIALRRVLQALRSGHPPEEPVRDGLWFALGAVLMIVPGFLTDAIGLALMMPALLRSWGETAVPVRRPVVPGARQRPRPAAASTDDGIVDLSSAEWRTVSEPRAAR